MKISSQGVHQGDFYDKIYEKKKRCDSSRKEEK